MICYVGDRHGFTGRHKSDQIQIYLNKLSAGGGHVIVYKKFDIEEYVSFFLL